MWSQTPFSMDILNRNILLQGNSYRELQQFIVSAVPQQNQKMVIDEIPRIMDNLYTEILASIQPVVTKNIIQMVKLFSSAAAALPAEDPAQHAETMANLNEIKTPMKPWCSHSSAFETPGVSSAENAVIQSNSQPRVESAKQEAMHLNTQPGVEAMEHELVQLPKSTSLKDTSVGSLDKKDTSLTTNILDDLMKESVQLPEISSEELCKLDNEYSIIPDLGNLIHFCDEIPVPVCLDLPPPNREIIDSMLPERIDITMSYTESSESFNLASYVSLDTQCYWESHWERRNAEGIGASRIDKTELFPGCKEASCDLDSSFDGQKESLQHGGTSTKACTVKDKKRSTCVSLNEMSASCIAPKKRIKMFEGNDATPTELVSNKASTPFGHNVVDDSWDDEETMSEILKSSDLFAKEYYAQKQKHLISTPASQGIQISEISPSNIHCNFSSNAVEKDVYNDIIARIPYRNRDHWVTLLICLSWSVVYYFNSLLPKKGVRGRFWKTTKSLINTAWKVATRGELARKGYKDEPHHNHMFPCQQQPPGSVFCGYYCCHILMENASMFQPEWKG